MLAQTHGLYFSAADAVQKLTLLFSQKIASPNSAKASILRCTFFNKLLRINELVEIVQSVHAVDVFAITTCRQQVEPPNTPQRRFVRPGLDPRRTFEPRTMASRIGAASAVPLPVLFGVRRQAPN